MRKHRAPTLFGLVPEGAVRRRPSDVVTVVVASGALTAAAWLARHPGDFGRWTFEIATDLPDAVNNLFRLVYFVGCVAIIAALTVACLLRRRVRLAISMTAAAVVTWLLGLGLGAAIGAGEARDQAGLDAFGNPPGFPAVRLAVAVSVLFVAAPYLTRPARRLVHLALLVVAASAVLSVESLFSDIVGSLILGWGVAALVHLVVGSPAGTPSPSEVAEALEDLDVDVSNLQLVTGPWYWTEYDGTFDGGSGARVEVIGRDARDAGIFRQLWRKVWYKGTGSALVWSRRRQVEHWAYLLLTAAKAGAHVGEVVAAGVGGRREDALLVIRYTDRTRIVDVPERLTDDVLDAAWHEVATLRDAHIAKGGVRGAELLVTADGCVVLDNFSEASYPAPPERTAVDAVDLLAVSANVVGVDRAVAAARRALGPDGLTDLLPLLQPAALSRGARREVDTKKESMKQLRTKTSAAAGVEEPKLAELRRVTWGDILMTVGTLLGVYLLIGQFTGLAGLGDVFRSANWAWLTVVILLSQLPPFAAAVAMIGSVMAPLPFGPVVGVQYANNFTGLVGGSVANVALVVRFLQKQGQGAAVAVSSGVLNSVAAFATELVLVPVTLIISGSSIDLSTGGGDASGIEKLVVLGIFVVGGAIGILLVVPALRRKLWGLVKPQWDTAKDNVFEVFRHPRKAAQLFGGKLAVEILFGMVLYASVETYGAHLGLAQLILINCIASFIGGAAPVPGGMGVVEAGLIAGMTAAGLPEQTAVAATFTHRLFTCYLPPIWGWFALAWLRRREYV